MRLREMVMGQRREGRTLVVVQHIAFMVSASVVGFAHAHGIVSKVNIAVIAFMGQ